MSLVGPRPIVEAEIEKYAEHYEQYVAVTPGLTGLWQISGRNKTTYEQRIEYDAYYVRNWSLWLDLHILISTVRVVLLREGAF
jgi:lipopolysaccharide/colanic/teichoic acid biosynthesis glycosyltransferase